MSLNAQPTTAPAPAAGEPTYTHQYATPGASDMQTGVPVPTTPSDDVSRGEPTRDYFRDAFNATRGFMPAPQSPTGEATPPGDKQEASGTAADAGAQVPPSAEGSGNGSAGTQAAPTGTSKTDSDGNVITLTSEELARRVQAETDRILAKRNREESARRETEELKELRRTDPYAYARRMEAQETEQAALRKQLEDSEALVLSNMKAYDATVLDPLFTALPDETVQKIFAENDPVGIVGRGRAAAAAIKALESHWKAQGVASARESLLNDQAFIKEVFTRYGGGGQEFEHVPAEGPSTGPVNVEAAMNDWMRVAASQVRSRGVTTTSG